MNRIALVAVLVSAAACGDNIGVTGLPGLKDLRVSDTAGSLYPDFESTGLRYGVRLADARSMRIRAIPADTTSVVLIDGEVAGAGAVSVDAAPGDVIDIEVRESDGGVTNYELVALPSDFPDLETTVLTPEASTDPLFVALRGSAFFIAALDNRGVPVFFRREDRAPFDFKRHPSGEYSYAVRSGAENEFGRRQHEIVVLDADLVEIDRVQTVGLNHTDNHDFLIRDNGNYTMLAYHGALRDMTAVGLSDSELVEESMVQEITRDREVVFEWTSFDEIAFDDRLRERADYAHANSVVYDTDGGVIVSLRSVSRVIKVDSDTGGIAWQLGGADNDFSFVDDPFGHLCGQHTASRLANGNVLIFDNGQMCFPERPERGELTRVVEYQLDEVEMTATLVWSYSRPDAYTTSQGSSQRLANGNTLIGWGRGPAVLATEVNPAGEVVFEIVAAEPGEEPISYRAFRFSMD